MSEMSLDAVLRNPRIRIVETPPPVVDVPSHADAVSPPAPTEEHIRAVDGAFLREQQEHDAVAGLIGLRLSVLLMHDLAKDALPTADEEDQPGTKPKGEPVPPAE